MEQLREGVFLFRGVFSPEVVRGMDEELERVVRDLAREHPAIETKDVRMRSAERGGAVRRGHMRYDVPLAKRTDHPTLKRLGSVVVPLIERAQRRCGGRGAAVEFEAGEPRMLVAFPGSRGQDWHTDAEPLFAGAATPPFLWTVMVATRDVTPEMGPTEFEDAALNEIEAGSVLAFHGLVPHRGRECSALRPVVYMTCTAEWWKDRNLEPTVLGYA